MDKEFVQDVYNTLTGVQAEGCRVPGVENAFAPGAACARLYEEMTRARERLWARLGGTDDEDVENILVCMQAIEAELCRKMFCYGAKLAPKDRFPTI